MDTDPGRFEITDGRTTVAIDPRHGGRVAQITVDGTHLLVDADDAPADQREADGSPRPLGWGSYPMVPWAGRIRRGRFEFEGVAHRLPANLGDHAIHGVGFDAAWTVTDRSPSGATLGLDLPTSDRWPFGGRTGQRFSLDGDGLLMEMTVTATDRAFPVSFGWHPWFRKPTRLDFHPDRMYRRDDDWIAVAELVDVPPGPWDDCFSNTAPVGLTVGGIDLELSSDCTDWVVYDMPAHATCVEPQTGPPDAVTIAPRVLRPGETHHAWYRIRPV